MINIRKTQIHKGQKFNRLTIIEESEPQYTTGGNKKRMVEVECDCGTFKIVQLSELTSGKTKSCGCYNLEKAKSNFKKHGYSGSRIHGIWKDMNKRCSNPNSTNYKNYGGRGVSVCDEWKVSFISFLNWSMENGYSDKLSIDRITVNGNYEPSNCRWVEISFQATNTRKQRPFKATDSSGNIYFHKCIAVFAREHNLSDGSISACLNNKQKVHNGWKFERLSEFE